MNFLREKAPLMLAALIGLVIAGAVYVVYEVASSASDYAHATRQYAQQTRQYSHNTRALTIRVKDDITAGAAARRQVNYETCKRVNRLTLEVRSLIVAGVKESKPFEHVFLQLGLPSYRKRLVAAYKQAATLTLGHCTSGTSRSGARKAAAPAAHRAARSTPRESPRRRRAGRSRRRAAHASSRRG